MLSTIFNGLVRYRRRALAVAVDVAVGCVAVQIWVGPDGPMPVLLSFLSMALLVLAMAGTAQPAPAALVVVPKLPALRTRPDRAQVCLLLGLVFMTASQAAALLGSLGAEVTAQDRAAPGPAVLRYAVVATVGLWAAVLWRGRLGLQLRPDGLVDRRPFGSMLVPWPALATGCPEPASPSARQLSLRYAQPELVQRRGWYGDPRRLHLGDGEVDAVFLGHVIDCYVANPAHRELIGTQAEYDELRRELGVATREEAAPATS